MWAMLTFFHFMEVLCVMTTEMSYMISPIAGAIIGYFTNWLAIKMLFKPHKEKRIFGMHVPFTPGLIPKEKTKLAKSMGKAIAENLLTEEAIVKALQAPEMKENFKKIFSNGKTTFLNTDLRLGEGLSNLFQKEEQEIFEIIEKGFTYFIDYIFEKEEMKQTVISFLWEKTEHFLSIPMKAFPLETLLKKNGVSASSISSYLSQNEDIKKIIKEQLFIFYMDLEKDERKLSEIFAPQTQEVLKEIVAQKSPDAIGFLLELAELPEISSALAPLIKMSIIQVVGKFGAFFVDENKVYKRILEAGKEYLEDEENKKELGLFAVIFLERILDNTVKKISQDAESVFIENVEKLISYLLAEKTLENLLERLKLLYQSKEDKKMGEILHLKTDILKELFFDWIKKYIDEFSSNIAGYLKEKLFVWEKTLFDKKINELLNKISPEFWKNIEEQIFTAGEKLVVKAAPSCIQALNISQIVEKQIHALDMEYSEKLVSEIAKKELNAITIIGGVLGFVIGCIPVLLELL